MDLRPRRGLTDFRERINPRRRLAPVALMLALLPTGCFSYTAAPPSTVTPGQDVRVTVAVENVSEFRDVLGHGRGQTMEGTILSREEDILLIAVATGTQTGGTSAQVLRQRVRIRADGIVGVEVKALDRKRTGLVVGAAAGALTFAFVRVIRGIVGSDNQPAPDLPEYY